MKRKYGQVSTVTSTQLHRPLIVNIQVNGSILIVSQNVKLHIYK